MGIDLLTVELLASPTPRLYMANTGNLGDALIRQGTMRFFRDIDLAYKEVWRPPTKKVGTFIYGGGGAWCDNWDNSPRVQAVLKNAESIIVLPSTYAIKSPLYHVDKIRFFSRDNQESLTYCPRALFHHDMAFQLKSSLIPKHGFGIGFFMRTDKERAGTFPLPGFNKDISLEGKTFDDTSTFVNTINDAHEVHTDRLHVAIVACMLQKKVFLYEGNYFKNKAVYLSSMKGRFDVEFREHDCSSHPHWEAPADDG